VRLPELDMLRLADQLRRARHDKEAILILLQLRPLVRAVSILDGQVVEAKFLLNLAQQLLVRLVEANPTSWGRFPPWWTAGRVEDWGTACLRTMGNLEPICPYSEFAVRFGCPTNWVRTVFLGD
jgi:hypothetical protein